MDDLRTLVGAFGSFTFELSRAARFPQVLYLAPEPAERFVRLTEAAWTAYPEFPPYEGAFDSIVPHLTVAEGETEILNQAEADIVQHLPIAARVREVVLFEEVEPDSARRRTRALGCHFAPSRRYSGMFPCFRFGFGSRFVSAVSSAEISTCRVRRGWITSST